MPACLRNGESDVHDHDVRHRLLKARGVADITKIRVDLEPGLRDAMVVKTGRRTVPQIYIGAVHVGGYEDLAALDHAGELIPLLADIAR
jgi:glutaredoxin 3